MDALPEGTIPLFPLQTVLCPDGLLPLRVFEVRYLDMVGHCYKLGLPFGVVCLTQGAEVRLREGLPEQFCAVGTLAQVRELTRPQPGLMVLRCHGGARFNLRQPQQLKHGLWIAQAQLLPNDVVMPVPADLVPVRLALEQLLAHVRQRDAAGAELPWDPPYRWDDCGWLANRWCELLPLPLPLKQQLMALESPLLRLELVADVLTQLKIGGAAGPPG